MLSIRSAERDHRSDDDRTIQTPRVHHQDELGRGFARGLSESFSIRQAPDYVSEDSSHLARAKSNSPRIALQICQVDVHDLRGRAVAWGHCKESR